MEGTTYEKQKGSPGWRRMEHVDPVESERRVPLMNRSFSSRHCNDEISEEEQQQGLQQNKHSDRRAPAIILGFECLESIAYFGISTNLVVYLDSVLHGSNASNAASVTTWTGTCYFTPVIGAVIADSFLGNYKMIVISLVIYLIGTVLITLSALSTNSFSGSEARSNLAFFSGLYLVAIGSGGVKSALLPFGADQFSDESIKERERKSLFFSLFYLCLNVGVLFSSTLIVWIQVNVAWALGFGITTVCIALALGGFLLGTPAYHLRAPSGSPLKSALQVLVAAFRKARLEAPSGGMLLYEVDDKVAEDFGRERLAHTNDLRFLDKAAAISETDMEEEDLCNSWRVCTVTRVEELKILLRLLPIWIAGVIFSAAYAQMSTTFIQQGAAMDTTIGSFSIPPASLTSFEVVSVMACVAAFNRFVLPLARRCRKSETGLSLLQRIGVGQSLMVLAMAAAAAVEFKRLDGARAGEAPSIAWQLPQYFLVACSEVFCFISQHEFFYGQAPETMRSVCTAFSLLAISVGSYLSSLIVTIAARLGACGGLSEGRMDYYFLMFTGLCAVNCSCYFVSARRYRPKQVVVQCAGAF